MNWFEQADFWYRFYDWMFPTDSFEQAEAKIDNIKKLLGRTSGKVLDLCCGPGRYSIPLKKAGFEVTGLEIFLNLLVLGKLDSMETLKARPIITVLSVSS